MGDRHQQRNAGSWTTSSSQKLAIQLKGTVDTAPPECDALWCATLTVGQHPTSIAFTGFSTSYGALTPNEFTRNGSPITVYALNHDGTYLELYYTGDLSGSGYTLELGSRSFDFPDLYDDFWYRAESWDRARRVVAKVEWHRGELFPRVGFIVTSMTAGPEGVVRFYNGRGTAEQWIKEGKYALNWTRLSCHRFVANRVRLSLFVLTYNLGNFLRRLCLPKAVKHWSLRSVQVKLIKMGGRLVRHSRWLIFQLSEVSVPRRLFQGVVDRIGRLSPAPS